MNIENFGKGALKTPEPVKRDHFRLAAEPPRVIDFEKGYAVENGFIVPQRDQDGSLSCTGQATSYYTVANHKIENGEDKIWSARYIYSQSFAPEGGAYIWKAMSIPLKYGLARLDQVPEDNSTEAIMRDNSLNFGLTLEAKADKYAQLENNRDINYLAGIVEDYNGFVTGFNGRNDMFDSKGVANIPATIDWGHAIWVCGYCKLLDGRKALKFKNSWTALWGDNGYGYFPEEFVKNGPLFDAYVYADILDLDNMLLSNENINVFYQAVFHRDADAEGKAYWVGKDSFEFLKAVVGSPEFKVYDPLFKAAKAIEEFGKSL